MHTDFLATVWELQLIGVLLLVNKGDELSKKYRAKRIGEGPVSLAVVI